MIFFLQHQPVTLDRKMDLLVLRAQELYGSDYRDLTNNKWLGDDLTVESLFPQWVIKAYEDDTTNVTVVPVIKNYMRWLLSQDYGYGASLDWENIRVPLFMNDVFLEAVADFYFPRADFSQTSLYASLDNLRSFLVRADQNYFNIKGTAPAIKYIMCSLLGFTWDNVYVGTSNAAMVEIRVASAEYANLDGFKSFIESQVIPAGMSVNYTSF